MILEDTQECMKNPTVLRFVHLDKVSCARGTLNNPLTVAVLAQVERGINSSIAIPALVGVKFAYLEKATA
jgi:hypothetical protein